MAAAHIIYDRGPGGNCFFTLNQYGYLEGPDQPVFLQTKEGTSTSVTMGGFGEISVNSRSLGTSATFCGAEL